MPTSEFFDKVFSPASKKAEQRDYYYYADNIFALNPRLVEDITPFQQLLVKETTNPKPYKPLKMLAWMGSANATTHLHYDWSHNFHAVLRGKKHFMLFPPSDWENLYLYPSLHPYGTKSQVDMTDRLEVTNFPRLNQAHGYEVEVSAGEALYIPPLWFHQVKALESSISVSIWSESIETVMFDQAVALGVPFDKEWTKKRMVLAAILFTEKLFTANEEYNDQAAAAPTKPEEDGMALHPAGILERVSRLFSSAVSSLSTVIANGQKIDEATEEETEKPSPSERGRNLIRRIILSRYQHVREKVVKEGERAASVWPLCPSAAEATNSDARTLLVSFSDSVDSLMELLGVIEAGRREIWLGDYLEIMANLVASPKEIIPYMGCLRGLLKPAA